MKTLKDCHPTVVKLTNYTQTEQTRRYSQTPVHLGMPRLLFQSNTARHTHGRDFHYSTASSLIRNIRNCLPTGLSTCHAVNPLKLTVMNLGRLARFQGLLFSNLAASASERNSYSRYSIPCDLSDITYSGCVLDLHTVTV